MRLDPLADPVIQSKDGAVDIETLIVGAGISGICMGIGLLRESQTSFVLLEAKDELGGTWRENTYPGVAVDIPSISYSFSFETDYPWSRHYAPGQEIQAYVKHCVQKYGVEKHIRYGSRVLRSDFDTQTCTWSTHLSTGEVIVSRYLVAATGLLSQPKLPKIPGLESFAGVSMHTARWDHDTELEGKRVAIIGTGASAVQIIPCIAPKVAHLSVFQRTPVWVAPRHDFELSPGSPLAPRRLWIIRALLRFYSELSLELLTLSIVNYKRFPFLVRLIGERVRGRMRKQLDDKQLAERLVPAYGLGCKRPATSNTYLPTFNRQNVRLVTDKIQAITPTGVQTDDGELHEVDLLILATGFLTTEQGNGPSFQVHGLEGV
ncbi:MAG: cation diffusion facilitator CzcD-associated flavoprotein CzcO, partial [Cognaticolwellia sp.]